MKKFIFDIQRFEDWATIISSGGTITVDESITTANGTDADETIQTSTISSSNREIYANGGADKISISGGFTGKFIYGSMLTIAGGTGSDVIDINGYYAVTYANFFINGDEDNDQISISGSNNGIFGSKGTIYGGVGDDIISIYGRNGDAVSSAAVSIDGGDGDDKISISDDANYNYVVNNSELTLNGGSGNDEISVSDSIFSSKVSISGGEGSDNILMGSIISNNEVTIDGGEGNDFINVGGNGYGISNSTVSISGGESADTISINSIINNSGVSIVAGAGDNISVGSGGANYLFDSTDKVTINGATFTASSANTSASLEISADITSIKSAWSGTVALSGTNSLADIDGSIVSDAGNYQIVDGKLVGTVEPVNPQTGDIVIANGKKYDVVFVIDNTGSMRQYIDDVKSNVNEFAQTLQNSGLNCRYGLVEFGDLADSEIKTYEFTDDVGVFVSNVNNISLTDGGDYPESGLEAIMNGALTMNFDADAEKRFIVVSDASFKNFDETGDGNSAEYLVTGDVENALRDNAVTMDVVGEAGSCRSEWEPLANGTGGKFYLLGSGFPSIFSAITTDIINIVDLNLVPENQTGYFVATQNSNTYTTPIFQTTSATGNDTAVGTVNEVNVYVADSDTDRQQTIIITDGWNATATKSADKLLINGVSATVTGGDDSDLFSLGSDTRTVTLMDLNIDEDKLSFGNYIPLGTMTQSIEDNHLVLTADDLRVDLPAIAEMTDEFLDYSVSNAGTSSTIRELLYGKSSGSGNSHISFSHWTFSFTPSYSESFSFL